VKEFGDLILNMTDEYLIEEKRKEYTKGYSVDCDFG